MRKLPRKNQFSYLEGIQLCLAVHLLFGFLPRVFEEKLGKGHSSIICSSLKLEKALSLWQCRRVVLGSEPGYQCCESWLLCTSSVFLP